MALRCALCQREIKGTEFVDDLSAFRLNKSHACFYCLDCADFIWGGFTSEDAVDYLKVLLEITEKEAWKIWDG